MKSRFEYARSNALECKSCGHSVPASGYNPEQVSMAREWLDKHHVCKTLNPPPKTRVLNSAPLVERARYVLGYQVN